jgi:hypothetical protein
VEHSEQSTANEPATVAILPLDTIELHDALIVGLAVDFAARSVSLDVEYYERKDSRHRRSGAIIFTGVESLAATCDLLGIQRNARAGNINYWVPAGAGGTTHLYLAEGCIAIRAEVASFEGRP